VRERATETEPLGEVSAGSFSRGGGAVSEGGERAQRAADRQARRKPPSARRARRRPRRKPGSDLGGRVLVAVPAAVAVIALNAAGGVVWTIALIALGILCLHELYELTAAVRPVKLVGFAALAGLLLAAHFGSQFQMVLVAVATLPVLFAIVAARPENDQATFGIAITILGVYWIGFALAHAVLLRDLPHGNAIVIDVLVGTFLGDTGAYFGGRMFGRRPLSPRISPNKTVEGLVIGFVTALLAVYFAGLYQDWLSTADALLLGVGVAVAGPVGDLFESFIKRDIGTKDTGRAFGAHGGALDRVDAALFTAVVGYYIWHALA
jgi:phosphatidate cytidylyltransferase